MMLTNRRAVEALKSSSSTTKEKMEHVALLIEGNFLLADPNPLTEPERFAQAAKGWIGNLSPQSTFDYASGWNTPAWEMVVGEQFSTNTAQIKSVFGALVILAKEAGIEL